MAFSTSLRRTLRLAAALGALVVAHCSCAGPLPDSGEGCRSDAECDSGYACLEGVCSQLCRFNADCEGAQYCTEDGICALQGPQPCNIDDDCATPGPCQLTDGATCITNTCVYLSRFTGDPCDDGDPCTLNDACDSDGDCLGEARRCLSPPALSCDQSDTVFTTYAAEGSCNPADGECGYTPVAVDCDNCRLTCLLDCDGVICADQGGGCQTEGVCVGGVEPCQYTLSPDESPCDLDGDPVGSANGICDAGECVGCLTDANCTQPPGDTGCYSAACNAGVCEYTQLADATACGADVDGPWSACGDFPTPCAADGSETRTVTQFSCLAGACVGTDVDETQGCTRNPEGEECQSPDITQWGTCTGFSGTCGESGTEERDVTTYACNVGVCTPSTTTESQPCTRDTDGTTCASDDVGDWTSCAGYTSTCDETGSRSRDITSWACNNGTCASSTASEPGTCTRDTDGTTCNTVTYGGWSGCNYSNACDESASESRTVTTPTCQTGSCSNVNSSETRNCSRNVADGTNCGASAYQVCCGTTCRDTRNNNSYCGSCTVNCNSIGSTCTSAAGGGYACTTCSSNLTCKTALDGTGNQDVTCWDVNAPPAKCQCQCIGASGSTTCADGGCGVGMTCFDCTGHNGCKPFGGTCN